MLKAAYGFSSFSHKAQCLLCRCFTSVAHMKLSLLYFAVSAARGSGSCNGGAAPGTLAHPLPSVFPLWCSWAVCSALGALLVLWVCSLLGSCSAFGLAVVVAADGPCWLWAALQLCSHEKTHLQLFLLDELSGDVCSGLRLKQGAIKRRLASKEESGRRPRGTLPSSSFSFHRCRKSPKL